MNKMLNTNNTAGIDNKPPHPAHRITVIGAGYEGLPLPRLFVTKYPAVGFDINKPHVSAFNGCHDSTLEISDEVIKSALIDSNPLISRPYLSTRTKATAYFVLLAYKK